MPNLSTTVIELLVVTGVYAVVLVLVVYLTRAGRRRVVGALAGGLAAAVVALLATTVAELNDWWRVPVVQAASGRVVILAGLAISMTPVYLVTWRVARRFGMRGLTVCVGLAAIVGPPRDYAFAAQFPNWMVFSAGMAPVLAVAVTYVLWIALGHGRDAPRRRTCRHGHPAETRGDAAGALVARVESCAPALRSRRVADAREQIAETVIIAH